MTAMPVVAHFRGDFLYNLVLIDDQETVAEVAEHCAAHSVGRRVAPEDRPMQVEHAGRVLDNSLSAADAGIAPMEEVIVSYVRP